MLRVCAILILIVTQTPLAHSRAPIKDTKSIEQTISFLLREVDTPYQLASERVTFANRQIREGFYWIDQLTLKNDPFNEESFLSQSHHPKVLISLLWGFFHLAVQKDQGFDQGTVLIEDPEQILFRFLIASQNAYSRPSSHFLFSGCKIKQYGIDFYGDWEEYGHSWNPAPTPGKMSFFKSRTPLPVLPANKTHILFGQLPAGECTQLSSHYVFIKPEDSGLGDLRSYLRHARDYLASRNVISGPFHGNYYQIERVDPNWLDRFEALIRSDDQWTESQIKNHIKNAQQWGIRYMLNQASQIQESSRSPITQELAQEWIEALSRRNLDHLESRTGKEVIFSWSDLLMLR